MGTNPAVIIGGPAIVSFKGAEFYSQGDVVFDPGIETFAIETDRFQEVDQRVANFNAVASFSPIGTAANLSVLYPYANTVLGDFITPRHTIESIVAGTDVITITGHGMATETPVRIAATTTLDTGATAATLYYVRAASTDTVTLHPTAADATANTNILDLAGDGVGDEYLIEQWPMVIHGFDGKKLTLHNAAVVQMPTINFGATQQLWGEVQIEAFPKFGADWSDANSRYTITTEALSAPTFDPATIITQPYTLTWGSAPWASMATKEGATMNFNMGLEAVETDADGILTRRLSSLGVEVTAQPIGPNISDLLSKMKMQGAGAFRGASLGGGDDLDITGTGMHGRLYAAALTAAPTNYSTTSDRVGQLTWQATRSFTGGSPDPLFYVGTSAPS